MYCRHDGWAGMMGKADLITKDELADTLFAAGVCELNQGQHQRAEIFFRHAIRLAPAFGAAHSNLGYLLEDRGDIEQAERCYLDALETGSCAPELYLNLGALLTRQQRFREAYAIYQDALRHCGETADLLSNIGVLQVAMRQDREAEASYRRALSAAPQHRSAAINLAHLLLRKGRYPEGWACLEKRDWYEHLASTLPIPRWHGETLQGANLLITPEAGLGDMIQFCRYVGKLKPYGISRTGILCQPELVRLFETLESVDAVIAIGNVDTGERWDYWCPLLSLPGICGTTLENIPAPIPYLHAKQSVPLRGVRGERRVGLVWKGNPRFESDASRSLPHLAHLAALWSVPGVRYFSLQKGPAETEALTVSPACPLETPTRSFPDFADTASAILALDLVISVDTAVAHLAGALGKPCWVLLPAFNTDWRWLEERSDSPWYPKGMRLFRQQNDQEWKPVVQQVEQALREWMSSPSATHTHTYAI